MDFTHSIVLTLYNFDDDSQKIDLYVHPTQSFEHILFLLRKRLNCHSNVYIELYEIGHFLYFKLMTSFRRMKENAVYYFQMFLCVRKKRHRKLTDYDVLPHQTLRRIREYEQIQPTL